MVLRWWSQDDVKWGDYDVAYNNVNEDEEEEMENYEDWANDPQHPGPELHLVSRAGQGRRGGGAADNLSPFPA